jgi:hypothetical protein
MRGVIADSVEYWGKNRKNQVDTHVQSEQARGARERRGSGCRTE